MADEPPSEPTAEPAVEASPRAADAATSLAAGVGLAFGGATENLQDVINVVFDVVQKQQVVIASTRAELDRQRAEHELLKQRFSDEMGAMRGELQAVSKGEPLEETKPYSVVVGSLPPDHSNECMQKLLDAHEAETGEEHAVAEVDDPIHEKKWAAAHQVLHFDTAAAALRAVKALHGRAHHKGPPQPKSSPKPKAKPQTATFTNVGSAPKSPPKEPVVEQYEEDNEEDHPERTMTATIMHNHRERHGFERQLLVRHVASATALDEVLGIVDEFLPASEPSSLDRFGLRVIRFPDRAEALKAASALAGHFVCGARVEAGPVHAADSIFKLGAALEELCGDGSEEVRSRTLVISAAQPDASSDMLSKAFRDVDMCEVRKAPGGFEFEIGRVVFTNEGGLEEGLQRLEGARVRGGTLSGAPALEDRLAPRVARLEAGLDKIAGNQDAFLDASDIADLARMREVTALAERVDTLEADLIAEIARREAEPGLRSPPKSPPKVNFDDELEKLSQRLDLRVDALEDALEALRDQRARPVVVDGGGDVDEGGIIEKAAAVALAKLEEVGVVEKDGSEFVLAETIKNETCIAYCDDAVKPFQELEKRVEANSLAVNERLGREEFAGIVTAACAGGETSLKPLLDFVEAQLDVLRDTKADKKDVQRELNEVVEKQDKAREDVKSSLERDIAVLSESTNRSLDEHGQKIEVLEEAVEEIRGQIGGPGLEEFAAKQKKIDAELQKAVELQHQGLEKATESLESAMDILNSLPSTDTVIDMIDTSKEEVVSAVDEVTGALKLNLEGVRRDVVRKTAREDVLRLIAKALREAMDRLRPHDDALMIGRAPVRCIACNTVMDSVHDKPAAKVIHGALSAQSATVAGDSRMGSVQEHRANVVIQASYATGRAGALRPLVKATTPGIPLPAPRGR